jgi:hypothetical protein
MGYTHVVEDDDKRLVEQLDELFCPTESQAILRAKMRASPIKKPLRRTRKDFGFNNLFGCGGWI